ncbi:MAG: UDP-N-acetylmuramate dehydrogenase [Opitutaceae bacterium]|jgi:UDP-N-acetylmuramate--L-alanine ligase/UDP-N-acetylenolpyruvoylglucosamine reductase
MRASPLPRPFDRDLRAIHLVGVGGTGMAPLALCLRQTGFTVSGEDDALPPAVRAWLEPAGVAITEAGDVPEACELVVHSSAIPANHPARVRAAARGLPLVRRGEMLAELLGGKKLVAVVGAHGKTTTTGMLITALRRSGFPCGWLLGGLFNDDAVPPGRIGSSDWVVAEIDESDGTIDRFSPEITVMVSLDWDHPDYYGRIEQLEEAFRQLVARTRQAVVFDPACAMSVRAVAGAKAGAFTFGANAHYRSRVVGESASHLVLRLDAGFPSLEIAVRAWGAFNAHNATAALAAAHLMGARLSPDLLADYPGVRRRQSVLRATDRLTIVEDYAHHPAEIRALLASLRQRKTGRLVVVFQPHRFSRTAQFKAEFAAALSLADQLFLLDVYPAGEAPVPGGTTADIHAEIKKSGAPIPVTYLPGRDGIFLGVLRAALQAGDWLAFVGAGDIDQLAHELAARLEEDSARAQFWDRFVAEMRPRLSAETRLIREEPLAPRTTMRTGGGARCYCEPANVADLQALLREAAARKLRVYFLGRGSNLIVPDEGVDGLVVCLAHPAWQACELRPDGCLWAGAGLRLKSLCGFASRAGLTGFEFLEGIPGSVGGALRMNAGAMGGWMFDVVEEVQLMTLAGEVRTLKKSGMRVAYRECRDLLEAIALGALLKPAAQVESEAISRQIDVYRRKRHESQPREPSAGCVFRNPPGTSAGKLIDEAGLKGERVGDAEVSPVHANFIINRGQATSADIITLMRRVRERVKQARAITLEPEVLLYGKEWKDVL